MTAIVIFRCGETRCALDRAVVGEVTPVPELSRPPGMPASLEGFLNLGGEAIAVVAVATLFGLEPDPGIDPNYRHILVAGAGKDRLGLLVDRVQDVRTIDAGAARVAPQGGALNDCVAAELTIDDRNIHLLAIDRILLAAEKARLEDLRRAEQARLDALAAP